VSRMRQCSVIVETKRASARIASTSTPTTAILRPGSTLPQARPFPSFAKWQVPRIRALWRGRMLLLAGLACAKAGRHAKALGASQLPRAAG
jgi:hypothetical protein